MYLLRQISRQSCDKAEKAYGPILYFLYLYLVFCELHLLFPILYFVFENDILGVWPCDKAEKADGPILSRPEAGSRYMDEHFQHWGDEYFNFSQISSWRISYFHRNNRLHISNCKMCVFQNQNHNLIAGHVNFEMF